MSLLTQRAQWWSWFQIEEASPLVREPYWGNTAMDTPVGLGAHQHIQNACHLLARNFHPMQNPTFEKFAPQHNSSAGHRLVGLYLY
jgi:hypothetical protein